MSSQASSSAGAARIQFLRRASLPTRDSKAPPLEPRWMHKGELGGDSSSKKKQWIPFSDVDHEDIEAAWRAYCATQQYQESTQNGKRNGGKASTPPKTGVITEGVATDSSQQDAESNDPANEKEDDASKPEEVKETDEEIKKQAESLKREAWDPSEPVPPYICPVGEDHLWEADFRDMKVHPAFWPGPAVELLRATWWYDGATLVPVPTEIAEELEQRYQEVQPYSVSYSEELALALKLGADAEKKIACSLERSKAGSHAIFLGAHLARIYGKDFGARIARTIITAVSGEHGGGTLVVRGWRAASKMQRSRAADKAANSSKRSSVIAKSGDAQHEVDSDDDDLRKASQDGPPDLGPDFGSTEAKAGRTARKPNPIQLMEKATRGFWDASKRAKANVAMLKDQKAQAETVSGSTGKALVEKLKGLANKPSGTADDKSPERPSAEDGDAKTKEGVTKAIIEDEVTKADPGDSPEVLDEDASTIDVEPETSPDAQPIELFLVLHGIGQGMVVEHAVQSWSFTTAINSFRKIVNERASSTCEPIMRGARAQFIPVLWREAIQTSEDELSEQADFPTVGLQDIFGDSKSIPLIRQVISGVLIDIPMYMSPAHHAKILNRVIGEMNRLYSLFLQRNPRRTGSISVNIIGHSLGSAIAADVLGRQPNHFTDAKVEGDALKFDVKRLYTIGSPAALFFWMNRKTLIGREGRAKSTTAPAEKEATDITAPARFGSLAVDQIWNTLYSTDPVATRFNPCVHLAGKEFMPVASADVIEELLKLHDIEAPSTGSKVMKTPNFMLPLFSKFQNTKDAKQAGSSTQEVAAADGAGETSEKAAEPASDKGATLQGLHSARHHYSALNPVGSIDYVLPSVTSSAIIANDYLDSIFAHGAYWGDHNFATFLLVTAFANDDEFQKAREHVVPGMWSGTAIDNIKEAPAENGTRS